MNNKVIIGGIIVLVLIGAGLLLTSRSTKEKTLPVENTTSTIPSPSVTDPASQIPIIDVTEAGYKPATLTVSVGTRVNWVNKTSKKVTVHSADHPTHLKFPFLNLGEFAPGGAVQTLFEKPGTFTYHNHYDSKMSGTVVVK